VSDDPPEDSPLRRLGQVGADDPEALFLFGVARLLNGFAAEVRRARRNAGKTR
jgi:hypothetical protein